MLLCPRRCLIEVTKLVRLLVTVDVRLAKDGVVAVCLHVVDCHVLLACGGSKPAYVILHNDGWSKAAVLCACPVPTSTLLRPVPMFLIGLVTCSISGLLVGRL